MIYIVALVIQNALIMTENEISFEIRGAIYDVYNALGPGLLESVYKEALIIELHDRGLEVSAEVPISVFYKKRKLNIGFRIDLLIEGKVIVEVKSVEKITKTHHKQTLNYLKISKLKLAILVNFNLHDINKGIYRKVNHL